MTLDTLCHRVFVAESFLRVFEITKDKQSLIPITYRLKIEQMFFDEINTGETDVGYTAGQIGRWPRSGTIHSTSFGKKDRSGGQVQQRASPRNRSFPL